MLSKGFSDDGTSLPKPQSGAARASAGGGGRGLGTSGPWCPRIGSPVPPHGRPVPPQPLGAPGRSPFHLSLPPSCPARLSRRKLKLLPRASETFAARLQTI